MNLIERRPIRLTVPAIDVLNFPIAIDHQGCRMRDVDRIHAQPVIQPVSFGHRPVLIQQKRETTRDATARNFAGFHTPVAFSAAIYTSCAPACSISVFIGSN